ncbi:MAG TPA: DUF1249 domain-containing protein [Xanthomonadales bacterium]|nr:DUF1249 domain-containing protein [Xanthomonadales bacterium]
MVSFRQTGGFQLRPKLKRLQDLQEDIYRQLQLLIPDEISFFDNLSSRIQGSPLLRLQVLERHTYTTFFRLTYEFRGSDEPDFAPDAHIRYYHDARLAEATSFDCEQACRRSIFPAFPSRQAMQKAWRENRALDRWLDYLLRQGHSVETMKASTRPEPSIASKPLKVVVE